VIVLDASVMVELILATPTGERVESLLEKAGEPLNAPHLLSVEVTHVLRRLVRSKVVTDASAQAALGHLSWLPVRRWGHEPLLDRMWDLRDNLSAYDASYVALAEALEARLVTTDARLHRFATTWVDVEMVDTLE